MPEHLHAGKLENSKSMYSYCPRVPSSVPLLRCEGDRPSTFAFEGLTLHFSLVELQNIFALEEVPFFGLISSLPFRDSQRVQISLGRVHERRDAGVV